MTASIAADSKAPDATQSGGPVSGGIPGSASTAAAFFDIDNTLIRGASTFHLARAMRRRGLLRTKVIAEFALRHAQYLWRGERVKDLAIFQTERLEVIRGISVAEVVGVGEELYEQVLAHRIFPATKRLLDQHRQSGHEVWLVSAAPIEIGSLLANKLGATGALGTVPEREDGFYTGRLVGGLLHGPAKADAVTQLAAERGLDLPASFAYGDSASDVPLLDVVGNACGINPDRRLRAYCAAHGWPVRDFRGKRRAMRHSFGAAWRVGASWALYAVVRSLVRRLRRR
ncbi:MAG: HAD-IB family hydrolase [Bifidobacteriaceae bacterium]|jgi:HAD superfamily hydrolase (TIGR01490 family)|nr:HAD-IB family hydrolase [Bifidobacteriaceae bacterium]